ncbi:hypothetical protein GLOIN_2v1783661 [Rhizophagus clarus]|uniref:RNase H type-1 domain-containing protein n=1 Tax=Rhizophagus clarus TaxID=94130 RepID=A0A8H3LTB8_9GLOM|nr:hypothetical protein GLOIN_2v1783661 [Rhizophagus clarus]
MSPKTFKACFKVLRRHHLFYLSQLTTPTGSHLVSWTAYQAAYIAHLADKCGRSLPHKWYLDIQAHTTIPDSYDRLYDRFTSDCLSSPGDVIRLRPCLGCDAHVPFPLANKYAAVVPCYTFTISLLKSLILPTNCERIRQTITEVVSSYSWADLCNTVVSYSRCLNIFPDFSSSSLVDNDDLVRNSPSCGSSCLPSPIILPPGFHYCFYTDGSLINLGLPDVSMGWSLVQIIHDAGYLNSVATYAHGTIRNWLSSTRAEVAAIFAVLSVSLDDSTISIYMNSQAAVDGLRLCISSSYINSYLYYKTTNFELWASIECSIHAK